MKKFSAAVFLLLIGGFAGSFLSTNFLQGQAASQAPVPMEMTSYRDVVKKVLPAIVSVDARQKKEKNAGKMRQRGLDAIPEELRKMLPPGFGDLEMPEQGPAMSFGSGWIIDPNGTVLTNYHVVANAEKVRITLTDGRVFTSTEIKGDQKNDLAIVRFKPDGTLPYLQFGDSDSMEIGDRVLALGAPFGLKGSVTSGIVSAKGRSGVSMSNAVYEDYLQTDAAINPGNSGGPLVNLAGKVIGINTAIRSRTGGFQGVGLAITSNLAKSIVDQLVKDGVVHRGYLGVQVQPLTPEVAEHLGLKEDAGVVVRQVFENTPASKAGIKEGDVISSVGGKKVKDGRELQLIVGRLPLKQAVEVALLREGNAKNLNVTIEEQPDKYGNVLANLTPGRGQPQDKEEVKVDKFGLGLADLTPEVAKKLGFKDDAEGALINEVEADGVAAEKGLSKNMLITKINKKPVATATEARDLLQKGNLNTGVLLQLQLPKSADGVGGGIAYIVLKDDAADK